ncbi:PIG-L domain-containing protein [Parapedobacter pyrenivorans]|uniref:PIG-L domain-containing protein n=1 Tax=Parapedobacter pyrenivorans TaxID=1305674 RepID=A0A917MHB9_9SPHI|nr:PIG-L family deacetylase [Parapedobacter pyrenivorans]GGH03461.1 PIG-L domain-containing protein [Parapedobacter pyrenivorans]
MTNKNTVLCLMAHPDDAEILSGGLLALLAARGWQVTIATMTPGQAGSTQLDAEAISAVRRKEAAAAAAVIGGNYHCLESEDIFILYDKPTLLKVIALFREVQPTLVITASPDDYMLDHEITSHLIQTACMAATIPNIVTPGLPLLRQVPHLYYADAVHGKDRVGREIVGDTMVDITDVMATKETMLCCHHSQRDWLRSISKVDEFVLLMKSFSERNGKLIGQRYAEGYRQHLGFSYPQDNLLATELGTLIHEYHA